IYRIIDFTLSNCINSDLRKILVLTQYKAVSLARHIDQGWRFLTRELDEYIEVIPPQQRIAEHWYQGTADAIYQNVYTIEKAKPLFQDAAKKEGSHHDFGKDIIPSMLEDARVFAYPFRDENRKQGAYWRDVGTLDAYFQTNMDLISVDPILNLYDRAWPIHTY